MKSSQQEQGAECIFRIFNIRNSYYTILQQFSIYFFHYYTLRVRSTCNPFLGIFVHFLFNVLMHLGRFTEQGLDGNLHVLFTMFCVHRSSSHHFINSSR